MINGAGLGVGKNLSSYRRKVSKQQTEVFLPNAGKSIGSVIWVKE